MIVHGGEKEGAVECEYDRAEDVVGDGFTFCFCAESGAIVHVVVLRFARCRISVRNFSAAVLACLVVFVGAMGDDDHLNATTKARYYQKLQELLPAVRLPDAKQERMDPDAADRMYESCVHFLREKTRNRERFPLIFDENVSYGFRRNLWAMKSLGIVSTLLGVAGTALRVLFDSRAGNLEPVTVGALIVNVVLFVMWVAVIDTDWVKVAADAYAERLLASCDEL